MKSLMQQDSRGVAWLRRAALSTLCCWLCVSALVSAEPPLKIRIFANSDGGTPQEQDAYRIALLWLALEKATRPAELDIRLYPDINLTQAEFINLLDADRIDIAWSMTSRAREAAALPIRVPIYRGLMGWRIGFIRSSDRERFAQMAGPDKLKQVLTGQGHDWPDTKILRFNDFRVESRVAWSARFSMLSRGRFDYFPRSIIEIWHEQQDIDNLAIEVESRFALSYPTAFYFFTSKRRQDVASLIEEGLQEAVNDGSFEELFSTFHRDFIERSQLEKREVLYLENPLLPAATPLSDSRLWYRPLAK